MSGQREKTPFSHDRAFDLLPWYVTGTLSDGEAIGVKEHVRSCLVCRRELDAQQRIGELVADADLVPLTPQRSFHDLVKRLEAEEAGHEKRSLGMARWLAWTTSPLPVAAGLGALMLIGISLLVISNRPDQEPAYRTLSQDAELAPNGTPLLRLIFADTVEHSEAMHIVSEFGAEVVASSSTPGAYIVRVAQGDLDRVLETLRRDPRVRFAEPTLVLPNSD